MGPTVSIILLRNFVFEMFDFTQDTLLSIKLDKQTHDYLNNGVFGHCRNIWAMECTAIQHIVTHLNVFGTL